MKKIFLVFFVLLLVVGCAPSPEAIQKSIAKTQTAQPTYTPSLPPTPTPTPIPLSKINLEDILIVEGDFPQGYVTEPIGRYTDNPILGNIDGQEQMIIQEFSKTNEGIGIVAIYLFTDITQRNTAYDKAVTNISDLDAQTFESERTQLIGIGEKGLMYFTHAIGAITFSKIIFVRCSAFVYAAKSMDDEMSSILSAYAKRLDARLSNLICR